MGLVPVLGNSPETVAATKDPLAFAALLARLGLPHPPTTLAPPGGGDWLGKMIGGARGGHIAPAASAARRPRAYYPRRGARRAGSGAVLPRRPSAHSLRLR